MGSPVYLVHTCESGGVGQSVCSLIDPRRACRREERVQMSSYSQRGMGEKDAADRGSL